MSKLSQLELWEQIQKFNLDDPTSSYPFSQKLADHNNWSSSFTKQAIAEYKKFIYLCCISPTGASPSQVVDEVWHLHLTYTDNYWNKFCKQTLQKEIHHHPSKGGITEKEKHHSWYDETLQLYSKEFSNTPPLSIWPTTEDAEIDEPIYEKKFFRLTLFIFLAVFSTFIIATKMYTASGQDFLVYYPILVIIGIVFTIVQLKNKSKKLEEIVANNIPRVFNKWHMIRFLNGPHGCYQAALIDLIHGGKIEMHDADFIVKTHSDIASDRENPLWQNLKEAVRPGEFFTYNKTFALFDLAKATHPGFEKLFKLSKKTDYYKFIIPGLLFLAGVVRAFQGLANNKPVDYLVMEMGLTCFILLAIHAAYSYTTLVRKKAALYWSDNNADGYTKDFAINYSIIGIMAISSYAEYPALDKIFTINTPRGNSNASSSCSSCTGGSSCGSGCGGGGCGGD
jgi:hypothetical protein